MELLLPFMLLFATATEPHSQPTHTHQSLRQDYSPPPPPTCPCGESIYGECAFGFAWRTYDDLYIGECPKCHSKLRSVVWVSWKKRFEYEYVPPKHTTAQKQNVKVWKTSK